jgi:hypothetical protein
MSRRDPASAEAGQAERAEGEMRGLREGSQEAPDTLD